MSKTEQVAAIRKAFPEILWFDDFDRFRWEEELCGNVSRNGTVSVEGPPGIFIALPQWTGGAVQVIREALGMDTPPVVTPDGPRCGRCTVANPQGYRKGYQWGCGKCRALNIVSADTPMRRIREAHGLTFEEVALSAGLDIQALLYIEVGRSRPRLADMLALLDVLDPSPAEEVALHRFWASAGTLAVDGPAIVLPLPKDDADAAALIARVCHEVTP